jgi:hypothetical protein
MKERLIPILMPYHMHVQDPKGHWLFISKTGILNEMS